MVRLSLSVEEANALLASAEIATALSRALSEDGHEGIRLPAAMLKLRTALAYRTTEAER